MNETTTSEIEKIIPILTKADLIARTEQLVHSEGLGYAEAIVHISNELTIDIEDIAKLVTGPLKSKLESEAQRNNYLPKSGNLFDFL